MYAGLVDADGGLQLYDGAMRFVAADGKVVVAAMPAEDYQRYIGEARCRTPISRRRITSRSAIPTGFTGLVRWPGSMSPTHCGPPGRRRVRRIPSAVRRGGGKLLPFPLCPASGDRLRPRTARGVDGAPDILDAHVRAHAGVNALEGVGIAEAPRGMLIHHYKVNEGGAITWANLIVATGHNNLAISRSVDEVARHFIHERKLQEGVLNRVSAVVRAYDPCLSCSTHAAAVIPSKSAWSAPTARCWTRRATDVFGSDAQPPETAAAWRPPAARRLAQRRRRWEPGWVKPRLGWPSP